MEYDFPKLIRDLPEANIPFRGVRGWISQADTHQVVFMEIEPIGKVDAHAHGAQWGMVIEGEMDLTIGGVTKTYRKGDSYFIGEGVVHSAAFRAKTWVVDMFADVSRYKAKP